MSSCDVFLQPRCWSLIRRPVQRKISVSSLMKEPLQGLQQFPLGVSLPALGIFLSSLHQSGRLQRSLLPARHFFSELLRQACSQSCWPLCEMLSGRDVPVGHLLSDSSFPAHLQLLAPARPSEEPISCKSPSTDRSIFYLLEITQRSQ